MRSSIRHIKAIFIKEINDYYKNPFTLIVLSASLIVFFIIFLIHRFKHGSSSLSYFNIALALDYNISFSCTLFPPFYIVEEKEKRTLDSLILSGISPLEFLLGKNLPTVLITMLTSTCMLLLAKVNFRYLPSLCILIFIVIISEVILMSLIGIISKNSVQSLMYSLPFVLILLLAPMLSLMKTFNNINNLINVSIMNFIIKNILNGKGLLYSEYSLLIVLIWLIIPSILFILIYKTKKLY